MDWIRFDKRLPPEDTTIMVSNGPAMGTYHYKNELFFNPEHQVTMIILYELCGKRVECQVGQVIQWSPMLKSRVDREKIVVKPKSLWAKFKEWLYGT